MGMPITGEWLGLEAKSSRPRPVVFDVKARPLWGWGYNYWSSSCLQCREQSSMPDAIPVVLVVLQWSCCLAGKLTVGWCHAGHAPDSVVFCGISTGSMAYNMEMNTLPMHLHRRAWTDYLYLLYGCNMILDKFQVNYMQEHFQYDTVMCGSPWQPSFYISFMSETTINAGN